MRVRRDSSPVELVPDQRREIEHECRSGYGSGTPEHNSANGLEQQAKKNDGGKREEYENSHNTKHGLT